MKQRMKCPAKLSMSYGSFIAKKAEHGILLTRKERQEFLLKNNHLKLIKDKYSGWAYPVKTPKFPQGNYLMNIPDKQTNNENEQKIESILRCL
jgi:hypothetical protein